MQLEDSSSRIAELSIKLDEQFKLSNQQFYDRMDAIKDLEVQLFDSDQLIVKKDSEIEKLVRQFKQCEYQLNETWEAYESTKMYVDNLNDDISKMRSCSFCRQFNN